MTSSAAHLLRTCVVLLLVAGCYDLKERRADVGVDADALDVIDAAATPDTVDASDTPDAVDVVDAQDVVDALDAVDVADAPPIDAPDVVAVDPPDAVDAPDVPAVDACTAVCTGLAPRPLSPLSTATVTTARPTLRWELPSGVTRARVDLCRDRACTSMVTTTDVTGTSWQPGAALATGAWFWRLRSVEGASVSAAASPTWEFLLSTPRATAVDSSAGSTLDLNGDGLVDVVVGAPTRNLDGAGQLRVHYGAIGGLAATASVTLVPPAGVIGFGQGAASAGDVNGDGFGDLLVAYNRNGPEATDAYEGGAYLFLGGTTGVATTPFAHFPSLSGFNSRLGLGVVNLGTAGDLDRDGYGDVFLGAVGAHRAAGHGYVYLGSASGIATGATPRYDLAPAPASHYFASAYASADFNGDGRGDLAVMAGSIDGTAGAGDAGRAYVYFGTGSGLPAAASLTLLGSTAVSWGERFGWASASGDFNGDGYADLAVAATYANGKGAGANSGRVDVFLGGASGTGLFTGVADASFNNPSVNGRFGSSLAARDLDGDGYDDLLVGTPDFVQTLRVHRGGASGLATTAAAVVSAPIADIYFGGALNTCGDTDGDGVPEFGVGSLGVGQAYLYRGWRGTTVPTTFLPAVTFSGGSGSGLGTAFF